ncbi:MAG TPA: DUF1614 domain-containing protein [Stellaceae bacterium]|nr:DUF1614 domain-containing protein [Stellaceae bacterium]
MRTFPAISLLAFLILLILMPLLFGELMAASLVKLNITPRAALLLAVAIIFGGAINIPVKRIEHDQTVTQHPLALFGLDTMWPQLQKMRRETIIAINVGGCIIPAALSLWELVHLAALGPQAVISVAIACAMNIAVCYFLARPVAGIGILLPGLVPALVAAVAALVLRPEAAPPVAFVAGVAGPLIGADLLHLKEIEASATGVASIGGAGTFDGIVLSGIVAAYLA